MVAGGHDDPVATTVPVADPREPARGEQVTQWAARVRWLRGDGVVHEWTGRPSQDECWVREMAGYLAAQVPGATGSVVTRSVLMTQWVDADEAESPRPAHTQGQPGGLPAHEPAAPPAPWCSR